MLYTSLTIILVAFFVMLNSFAVRDMDAVRDAIGSLRGSFGIMSGGFKPGEMDQEDIIISQLDLMKSEFTLDSFFDSVMDLFRSMEIKRIKIDKINSILKITFPGAILFPSGSSQMLESAYPILDKFIPHLKKVDNQISIEGHSESSEINTSEYSSGWDLSIERAVKVTEFLEKNGIEPERLKSVGHSIYKPLTNLVMNYDDQMNRRVEIIVYFNSDEERKNGFKKRRDKKGSFEVDVDIL